MTKLEFAGNTSPTVGVELELGIIDSESLAMTNAFADLIAEVPSEQRSLYKPELMQSVVEVITGVCHTVGEAEEDLRAKLMTLEQAADRLGVRLWWGATHPFSSYRDQQVTPDQRYIDLVELLQQCARRLVTNGLHIHVGVDSGDKAVMICDRIMQHLPAMLALSCSSPFWEHRDTGLQSQRSKIMENLPTAGLPPLMRNWSEYTWLVNQMVDTGFINSIREIWWDVRPHHNFGTVEVRVCDMPGTLKDVLGLTAYVQCLVKTLSDLIDNGAYQHDCHPMLVRQNKWRASRFGNHAKLVNSFSYEVESLSLVVTSVIEKLLPAAQELDCMEYLEHVRLMANSPTWSDRQLKLFEETGDPRLVTKILSEESRLTPVGA